MISQVEKEDWEELIRSLLDAERHISNVDVGKGSPQETKACREALMTFHTTAAMLGRPDLERAGIELEQYAVREIEKNCSVDAVNVFSFAVNALVQSMQRAESARGQTACDLSDLLDILGVETSMEAGADLAEDEIPAEEPEPAPARLAAKGEAFPVETEFHARTGCRQLEEIIAGFGGKLDVSGNGGEMLVMRFPASEAVVSQIQTLLSAGAPALPFASQLAQQDKRIEKVLFTIKDFMVALSNREINHAQEILLSIADQQHQAGLYKEIGGLARELHTSLKSFMDILDPSLREMVLDKLPDSGNRLEHMLELTEKAANTTIDHVEKLQKRIEKDHGRLVLLQENLGKLNAIGEQAQKRLEENQAALAQLLKSAEESHEDLLTVLTAQDYQDLTGQIIQKITQLLKDLEKKLINVIRTFGVKVDSTRRPGDEDLYGPAHKAKEEALHSQDDVDALLAEFGF